MTSPRYPGRPDPADTDPSDTDPVDPLPGDASAGPSAPASVVAARRRAVVLLVLCVVTAVSWAATLLGPLPLPVTLVSSVLLVAYVAALRSLARRREALRASRRAAAAPEPLPAVRARRTEESVVAAHPAPVVRRTPPSAAPMLRHATRDDDSVVLEPVAALEDELVAYDADGGTWVPVPVPPPTYTLKPMAPRPEQPAPGSATQAAPAAPSAAGAQAVAGSSPAAAASSPAAVGATQSVSGTPDGGQDDRPERTALTPAEVRARVLAQPLDLDEVLERRRAVND